MAELARRPAERLWLIVIALVSGSVVAAVAFLVFGPRVAAGAGLGSVDVRQLPILNAALNGTAALLLLAAYRAIRAGNIRWHRALTLATFATSTLFLVSYLTYHAFKEAPRLYTGGVPGVYYPLLISHICLAAAIVPLALLTLYRGWAAPTGGDAARRHRRLARVTFPLWLYVSVSGVAVFALLEFG